MRENGVCREQAKDRSYSSLLIHNEGRRERKHIRSALLSADHSPYMRANSHWSTLVSVDHRRKSLRSETSERQMRPYFSDERKVI